jgi:hypothetical protein
VATGLSGWKTVLQEPILKENWLEMLHYFVDMQNKTPQALIDQAQKSDGMRENSDASITGNI